MGSCCSISKTQNQNPEHHNETHQPHHQLTHEVAPPPPLEEEFVKEVLSETPISKPSQVPSLNPEPETLLPPVQNPDGNFKTKDPNPTIINKKEDEDSEVVSQFSDVVSQLTEEPCSVSVSESFSAATTATTATITEKREDEATSKRSIREGTTTTTMKTSKWNKNRSPSRKRPNAENGNVAGGRDRRLRSPARRTEPSPEKRVYGGPRPIRGRESGAAANRKLNVGPAGVRRDSGEGSGRRSRSPSCARTAGAAGKVGAGGGQKQVPTTRGTVKEVEKGGNGSEDIVGEKNDVVLQEEESIENPLVSMECFIFL